MEQLKDKELLEWATEYMKKCQSDINNYYGGIEKYYHLDTPKIPNMEGVRAYFKIVDMTATVNQICKEMREAHTQGKKEFSMRAINQEKVIFNLEPLFNPEPEPMDDLTLQKYVCRLFIHSKGG